MEKIEAPNDKYGLIEHAIKFISVITPIIVLVLGNILNSKVNEANNTIGQQKNAIEDLKIKAEELKIKVDAESAATKSQIEKVDAIFRILQDLTGTNAERRRVAMEAVKIILPTKEAISILTALNNSAEPGSKQSIEVKSVLEAERVRLIDGMLSYELATRTLSLRNLQQAWSTDEKIVRQLLERVIPILEERKKSGFTSNPKIETEEHHRLAIIYNTMAFLSVVSISDIELKKHVIEFASAAEKNSPDTAIQSARIKSKFRQ